MPTGTLNDTSHNDLIVTARYPDRTAIGEIYDYSNLNSKILEFGAGTADITIPLSSIIAQNSFTKNSTTKTGYAWGFSEYFIEITYKGQQWFDGIVVTADDEDVSDKGRGHGGANPVGISNASSSAAIVDVKLGCWTVEQWYLGGRAIYGTGGNRFAPASDAADDVLRAVLRANLLSPASGGIEPAAYGLAGVDREDFGSITVAVGADTGTSGDTPTFRWDHGESLWDQCMEFCRLYNLRITHSWSGTTLTFDVATGTGTDRTSTIKFDRERGNLLKVSRKIDQGKVSNAFECRGQGRRLLQVGAYTFDTASIANRGVRETGEVHRSADATDAANGAAFLAEQWANADVMVSVEIGEIPGCEYGDFLLSDKATVYDSVRALTVQDYIVSGELAHVAGSEVQTKFGFGRQPDNQTQQNSRSGGGGRGARKGGGKPKNKDGESVVDPDEIISVKTVVPDAGTTLVFDVVNDSVDIKKNNLANGGDQQTPNIRTYGVDPGTAEKLLIGVVGVPVEACVSPYRWWKVEFDTNGDGNPDTTYYVPIYTLGGIGCHNLPPPGTG